MMLGGTALGTPWRCRSMPTTARMTRLGTWPVRRLGDVSYSLYLWHWPLIVAAPWVLHGPVTARAKLALLASSLILAGLTTLLVEDPARAGRWWRARTVPAYAFAVTGVATLALLCSSVATGARHHERQVVAKTQARIQQQTETLVVTRSDLADPTSSQNYRLTQNYLNCGQPMQSLLLTKPLAGQDAHGGGDLIEHLAPTAQVSRALCELEQRFRVVAGDCGLTHYWPTLSDPIELR